MSGALTGPKRSAIRSTPIPSLLAAIGLGAVLFADVRLGGLHVAELSVAAIAAAGLIALSARFPGAGLCIVVIFTPLQIAWLPWLYKHGVPASFVRNLGYVKDAAIGGMVIAALTNSMSGRSRRIRLDLLDWCAIAYVGIATLYLLLPFAVPTALGGQPFHVRLDAWRIDSLFVVVMFAARRVEFSGVALRRARMLVVAIGILMLVFAIWESVNPTSYNNLLTRTLGLPAYQLDILKIQPPAFNNYVVYTLVAGVKIKRVGGLFADYIQLAFYMVIPLGLCLERLGNRRLSLMTGIGLAAALVTIVLTETRSAMLAGVVVIAIGVALSLQDGWPGRYFLAAIAIGAALLLIPLSAHSSARARIDSAGTTNQDSATHQISTVNALKDIAHRPQGKGLGSNPSTGQRYTTSNLTVPENSVLQVGTELGLAAMVAFVGMYLALLTRLRQRAKQRAESKSLAGAMFLIGCGLLVGGMFLQVWTSYAVSLTFWALAGAALSPASRSHDAARQGPDLPAAA